MSKNQIFEFNSYTFIIKEEIILSFNSAVTLIKKQILPADDGFICYAFVKFFKDANIDIAVRILTIPDISEKVYQICKNGQLLPFDKELNVSSDSADVWFEINNIKIPKGSTVFIDINNKDTFPRNIEIGLQGYKILHSVKSVNKGERQK